MKANIHPDYHFINVVMTDGTKYQTRSTYGKEGDTLQLDVDPKTHPAWVGGVNLRKTGQLEKFENRFTAFGKLSKNTRQEVAAAAAAAEKKDSEKSEDSAA